MGIHEKIKKIEEEMARTQKNKATEYHLGRLKAQLAKLRSQLLEAATGGDKGAGEGFEVQKLGHARVAMIGFPSVGKSSILSLLTQTESKSASYEFTTLTCIPGVLTYKDAKIQLLDMPGIIEGAAEGKGRGRQVIAAGKNSDLILMVLDGQKGEEQRLKLTRELETMGIKLNKEKPNIKITTQKTGGVIFNTTVKLTKIDEKMIKDIMHEYKIHNAQVMFRGDYDVDDLIDTIEGNRKYIKCLYVYNKIDELSIEEVDQLAHRPHSVVLSARFNMGADYMVDKIWEELDLVRVYTKKKGGPPDFTDPLVLTKGRGGKSLAIACKKLHKELLMDFKCALVWGKSVKHSPQRCGLGHQLQDEDVIQIFTKSKK